MSSPPRTTSRAVFAAVTATLTVAVAGAAAVSAAPTTAPAAAAAACDQVLFDDFNYTSSSDSRLAQRGWHVRSNTGGPGIPGAAWPTSNVSFPSGSLQLRAATDGTAGGTSHAEILLPQKFYEGTYAARVKFADVPDSGPDGDHLVETFFTITPLAYDLDPNYGEIDFEYLPNGGWGEPSNIMYQTTWDTYRADPWLAVNTHGEQRQSFAGWQDLVFTVSAGHVKYYINGQLMADHAGDYYPETPMSVNFNLWFIDNAAHTSGTSVYTQQVDYFYHSVGEVLTAAQVGSRIAGLRAGGVQHTDTVGTGGGSCPSASPPVSPSASASPSRPPSPSASPSRPPSPSVSPSASSGPVNCANAPAWDWGTVYLGGQKVKHNGHLWQANWWTLGSEPGWTAQWRDLGTC